MGFVGAWQGIGRGCSYFFLLRGVRGFGLKGAGWLRMSGAFDLVVCVCADILHLGLFLGFSHKALISTERA